MWVQEIEPLLKHTRQLIMRQYFDSIQQEEYWLLIFAMDSLDHAQKMIDSGVLLTWDDVLFESVAPWYFIYWDAVSRQRQKYSTKNLLENETIQDYIKTFIQNEAHIWFIAKPEWLFGLENTQLFGSFANALESSFTWSKVWSENQDGALILTFDKAVANLKTRSRQSDLGTKFQQWTPMYVELHNLLSTFGVTENKFVSIMPTLLWEQSPFSAVLSKKDLYALFTALDSPFSVSIQQSTIPGLWSAWAIIVFSDPQIFTVFQKTWPFIKAWLEETMGVGSILVEQGSDIWSFSVRVDNEFIGNIEILRIERKNDLVELAILWAKRLMPAKRDQSVGSKVTVERDAIASFLIDVTAMSSLFQGYASWMNLLWMALPQNFTLENDAVLMKWSIRVEKSGRQIHIRYAADHEKK
jgi:hypothetical protein